MKEQLKILMQAALARRASDIHLTLQENLLQISFRTDQGYVPLYQNIFDSHLAEYLRYISGMDLTKIWKPQSGHFVYEDEDRAISCRFSWLASPGLSSGVIRLLQAGGELELEDLSRDRQALAFLERCTRLDCGLVVSAGPTGSGKSTTIHALLRQLARKQNRKIVTLEDPVEVEEPHLMQLEVSEENGLTYEQGIEALLRHDPDVIFIGECRSAYTARMCVRAALTGHLVFTTLHAGSVRQTLGRLEELGVPSSDLAMVLQAVFAQRLFPDPEHLRKECVYEFADRKELEILLQQGNHSAGYEDMVQKIHTAAEEQRIDAAFAHHNGF